MRTRPCLPSRRCAAGVALFSAVLLHALSARPAAAGELHIAVRQLPCGDGAKLAADVQRAVEPLMRAQPDHALLLDTAAPGVLRAQLDGPDGATERLVPVAPADCAALGSIVALLVRGWLDRGWSTPAASPATAANSAATAPAAAGTGSAAAPAPAPARVPQAPGRWTAKLSVGGFSALRSDQANLAGAVGVDGPLAGRLGFSARLGREWAVTQTVADGSIDAEIWTVLAAVRWEKPLTSAGRLDLFAGPELDLVSAKASRLDSGASPLRADPTLVAGAAFAQRLTRSLSLFAEFGLSIRVREEVYSVTAAAGSTAGTLTLDRLRIRLLGGVAWDLD